jgi:hypothetical protein
MAAILKKQTREKNFEKNVCHLGTNRKSPLKLGILVPPLFIVCFQQCDLISL